jgi:citrate synthase
VQEHLGVPENLKHIVEGFEADAHPMAMLVSTVAALSTFYPESRNVSDPLVRRRQIVRLVAKLPTLAAYAYRHSQGLPYIAPEPGLSFTGNFLNMMFGTPGKPYEANPVLERALEVLFILHLDHEQNCSANAMRNVGSSQADPYVSVAAAAAALYGPLHGGANEQVLRMLDEIGTADRAAEFVERAKRGEFRLMGFGHRVYKNYDPRARFLKAMAEQVLEVTGRSPLLDLAMQLEKIALEDEYFVKRKLYPNVDFYSGIIYQAMGFPVAMFPVLFAIPRVDGWLAQWEELLNDPEQKIARPRQVYTGADERKYASFEGRGAGVDVELGF